MDDTTEGLRLVEWGTRALEWTIEHLIDLFFALLMIAVIVGATLLIRGYHRGVEEQIDLCVRAFERPREQCEFIVKNRIMSPEEP